MRKISLGKTSAILAVAIVTTAHGATQREIWRTGFFGSTVNAGAGADCADPDGDGIPNLLEYAYGTDPTSAASRALPGCTASASGLLSLAFTREPARNDANLLVEASADLAAWAPLATSKAGAAMSGSGSAVVQETGNSPVTVNVTDDSIAGAGSPRFLRFRVGPDVDLVGDIFQRLFPEVRKGISAACWQPLIASAPVVTSATSTGIGTANDIDFTTAAGRQKVNFYSANYALGTGYPNGLVLFTSGLTSTFGSLTSVIEFMTDGDQFELVAKQGGGAVARVWVDGALVSSVGVPLAGGPGAYPSYQRYAFGSAKTRKIRIEASAALHGIRVPSGAQVWPVVASPASRPPRCIVMGDSFTEGTGANFVWNGYAGLLRARFGWEVWISGSGGTGYLNPGPNNRVKFRDRVQNDVIDQHPDVVIIAGGINDGGYPQSDLQTEAGLLYDTILSSLPGVKLIVVGPWWPTEAASTIGPVRTALQSAASARGLTFIDPTNPASPWIVAANKQSYHPTIKAAGTATLSGNGVSSISVSNSGAGYAAPPAISFSGGGGTGAAATAIVDGRISSVSLLDGGYNYAAPVVTLQGGGGTGATATATVTNGSITGITVASSGTGYTSEPTVVITDAAGCGAAAVAAQTFVVTGVTITSAGTGYTSAPTVSFAAPSDGTHPSTVGHAYYAERLAFELQKLAPIEAGVWGATGIGIKRNSDTILGAPFVQAPAASGRIVAAASSGVNRQTFSAQGSPAWNANQFAGLYHVRFTSGAKKGAYYTIVANAAAQVTVDTAGDDLSGLAAGDGFQIVKYWTLGSLFPVAQAGTPTNPFTVSASPSPLARRSQLLLTDLNTPGINLSASKAFYLTNSGWLAAGTNAPANQVILYPDAPFTVRQPASVAADATWRATGAVSRVRIATPLRTLASAAQDNPVALARPLTVALSQLGLETGFMASASTSPLARRDQLFVFDNTVASFNKSAARVYYRTGGSWRKAGADGVSADADTIPAGDGFTIRKYQSGDGASVWWNNDPAY